MTSHLQYRQGYSIGVGGVVLHDRQVLLVRRTSEPHSGDWALPGGYIERDETVDIAVIREVFEETGISAEIEGLIGVLHRWLADENGVYLMFLMRAVDDDPRADGIEISEARFFALEELEHLPELQWLSRLIITPILRGIKTRLPSCSIPDDIPISNTVLYSASE
jgi:ADP-ribose pyrophosphatase YjhB (NUDIX family)